MRPEGTANPELATGEVELVTEELEILSAAGDLPFHQGEGAGEELRLKYRYLDLRRPEMLARLRLRHRVFAAIRAFLDQRGFVDVETPMLTRATPEGARDFITPARGRPGRFYALPQSPQLFKQLLMMSGLDRYYQIVRCFRDEDLRADRQPEFTQLDVEMSFVDENEVTALMETLVREVFASVLDVELPNPFPRMSYAEAMRRFASDAPDLRNPLELVELSDALREAEFKVFSAARQRSGLPRGRSENSRCRRHDPPRARRSDSLRASHGRQGHGLDQGEGPGARPRGHAIADTEVPGRRRDRFSGRANRRCPQATCCCSGPALRRSRIARWRRFGTVWGANAS